MDKVMPISLDSHASAFSRVINKFVPFMLSGEGYIPNPKSEKNPKLIQMDGFEMKFDPVTGVPFTLYPIK